jgi:hypothetical protein
MLKKVYSFYKRSQLTFVDLLIYYTYFVCICVLPILFGATKCILKLVPDEKQGGQMIGIGLTPWG